jgi:hypothetical protein
VIDEQFLPYKIKQGLELAAKNLGYTENCQQFLVRADDIPQLIISKFQ